MANRRMFSRAITESDAFTDMPLSAQALYFHLGMEADDDGFVNSPKRVQRGIGASNDDLGLLAAKNFVIIFASGVLVIKHWKVNNWIQSDRYQPTKYADEFNMLEIKSNGAYTLEKPCSDLGVYNMDTECIQTVSTMDTQDRLGKDRLGKVSKDKSSGKPDSPSKESNRIIDYLNQQTGKHFHRASSSTLRRINARLKDGFTVDDFMRVIDAKVSDWGNDQKMAKYLRPETLFGTKFESYLNEGGEAVDYSDYRF